jgi:serine/threonine protein kinase
MTVRFTHTTATARGGTPRYQAPELIELGSAVRNHYGSDVYAFACVCYEVSLTGLFISLTQEMMYSEDSGR